MDFDLAAFLCGFRVARPSVGTVWIILCWLIFVPVLSGLSVVCGAFRVDKDGHQWKAVHYNTLGPLSAKYLHARRGAPEWRSRRNGLNRLLRRVLLTKLCIASSNLELMSISVASFSQENVSLRPHAGASVAGASAARRSSARTTPVRMKKTPNSSSPCKAQLIGPSSAKSLVSDSLFCQLLKFLYAFIYSSARISLKGFVEVYKVFPPDQNTVAFNYWADWPINKRQESIFGRKTSFSTPVWGIKHTFRNSKKDVCFDLAVQYDVKNGF